MIGKKNFITFSIFTIVYLNFISSICYADNVIIETNLQKGKGHTIQYGDTCYALTPKHVIVGANKIMIKGVNNKIAEGKIAKYYGSIDLALIEIYKNIKDGNDVCDGETWEQKMGAYSTLKGNEKCSLIHLGDFGNYKYMDVNIVSLGGTNSFRIRPVISDDKIVEGMSGSVVSINNKIFGMLLSVKDNIGYVYRCDVINELITASKLREYIKMKKALDCSREVELEYKQNYTLMCLMRPTTLQDHRNCFNYVLNKFKIDMQKCFNITSGSSMEKIKKTNQLLKKFKKAINYKDSKEYKDKYNSYDNQALDNVKCRVECCEEFDCFNYCDSVYFSEEYQLPLMSCSYWNIPHYKQYKKCSFGCLTK